MQGGLQARGALLDSAAAGGGHDGKGTSGGGRAHGTGDEQGSRRGTGAVAGADGDNAYELVQQGRFWQGTNGGEQKPRTSWPGSNS